MIESRHIKWRSQMFFVIIPQSDDFTQPDKESAYLNSVVLVSYFASWSFFAVMYVFLLTCQGLLTLRSNRPLYGPP